MICLAEAQRRREDFWFLNHFCYLHSFKLCGLVRENIVGKWRIGKAGELLGRWEVWRTGSWVGKIEGKEGKLRRELYNSWTVKKPCR